MTTFNSDDTLNTGDEADRASALEEQNLAYSLKKHCDNRVVVPDDFDGLCVVCDEEIPEARLKLGVITCIHCQEKIEKTNKHIRR